MPADFRSELSRKAKGHLELEGLRKRLADQAPKPAATAKAEGLLDVGALPKSKGHAGGKAGTDYEGRRCR